MSTPTASITWRVECELEPEVLDTEAPEALALRTAQYAAALLKEGAGVIFTVELPDNTVWSVETVTNTARRIA